ncbi:Origin recognition complex subunit 3, partial [Coemansia sp. RSA 2673]
PLSVLASMLKRSASGALAVVGCPIRLSPEQLELVRMQKSVQRFLEQQLEETGDSQHFRLALSSDEYMQNSVLPQLLRRLASFRAGYCLGIDLVVALQDVVPESLQKPIRTLHYYAISQRFDDCMHWKALSAVMRRMKAPDMDRLLARINAIVEAAAIPDDHMLKALDQCCANIEAILRVCLSPYQSAPLHEVFYYKHSLLLDTTFSAQPRAAVQAALGKTSYYIDCDCCRATSCDSDDSGVSEDAADQRVMPSMQDTSIVYRLHQECGRMVNLYDWHSSFSSVVESQEAKTGGVSQRETQARFMRAVEEMRFLGFIKPTQRKTDHVVRLTWGM